MKSRRGLKIIMNNFCQKKYRFIMIRLWRQSARPCMPLKILAQQKHIFPLALHAVDYEEFQVLQVQRVCQEGSHQYVSLNKNKSRKII